MCILPRRNSCCLTRNVASPLDSARRELPWPEWLLAQSLHMFSDCSHILRTLRGAHCSRRIYLLRFKTKGCSGSAFHLNFWNRSCQRSVSQFQECKYEYDSQPYRSELRERSLPWLVGLEFWSHILTFSRFSTWVFRALWEKWQWIVNSELICHLSSEAHFWEI